MITALATRITEALCASSTIEESDKELYQYGFFLLLSHIFFLLLTALVGVWFQVPVESILFYIMFSLVRSYAGGIHAKTESVCILLTSFAIFISIAGMYLMKVVESIFTPLGMLLVGVTSILALCPLDTQEKPLSNEERKYYRQASWISVIGIVALAMMGIALQYYGVLYAASFTVALEGSLLFLGRKGNN